MKIYGDLISGNCYKLKLLCDLLSIEHEWVQLDILREETRTEAFLSLNPNAKVPLLELDDGRTLSESNAILNYLATGSALLPQDSFALAKVLQWQFFEQYISRQAAWRSSRLEGYGTAVAANRLPGR